MILAIAISLLPLMAAVILTAASGALVPKATIVNPIIKGEILKNLAIDEAPETKVSAPFINSINPIINKYNPIVRPPIHFLSLLFFSN